MRDLARWEKKVSNQTKFKLKSFHSEMKSPFENSVNESMVYFGAHNNKKTTYEFSAVVIKSESGFTSQIDLGDVTMNTQKDALLKLSELMKRAAETIDNAIGNGDL